MEECVASPWLNSCCFSTQIPKDPMPTAATIVIAVGLQTFFIVMAGCYFGSEIDLVLVAAASMAPGPNARVPEKDT